jgi:predicted O-methyltransferase YrrM
MSFKITRSWLQEYYGSLPEQVEQTRSWLNRYGKNVPPDRLDEWSQFKHLAEYQVNTNDIVDRCLGMVSYDFETELEAHRRINLLRVPLASSYEEALKIVKPKLILELGVGGDSAISTAIFLRHVEGIKGQLDSVDINPLGMTWKRYNPFSDIWTFTQADSMMILSMCADKGIRYDMVFIDTSHSYAPTVAEMLFASKVTDFMLMDDASFEGNEGDWEQGGVKRAVKEWCEIYHNWKRTDLWGDSVTLLTKEG